MEEHHSLTIKSIKCVCFKYLRKFVLVPKHLHSSHEKCRQLFIQIVIQKEFIVDESCKALVSCRNNAVSLSPDADE
jgi:hypothetical protein